MPWVRFDDHFPDNRKVNGLSDTAFRLHVSAIFWCARNLMDGVVPEGDLELVTARVRAPARFGTELVRRGLWHEAGTQCGSTLCPPSGPDGWVIHDYWEYQPTKVKVLAERAANAERQARWRLRQAEAERNALHGPNNGGSNGVSNGGSNNTPSRPVIESSSNSLYEQEFAALWDAYPQRKGGKAEALKAYTKARKAGTGHAEIADAVLRYNADRRGKDPQYTKHFSAWLNGRRWEDEYAPNMSDQHKSLWDN